MPKQRPGIMRTIEDGSHNHETAEEVFSVVARMQEDIFGNQPEPEIHSTNSHLSQKYLRGSLEK